MTEQTTESAEVTDPADPPALIPPKTNTGIKPTPVATTDILEKAAADPDFYRANRDAIRKAWFNR